MGYKRNKIYKLVWAEDSGDMAGFEVRCRSLPLGRFRALMQLLDGRAPADMIEELIGEFAGVIVDWNLEDDDDEPIAPTAEVLLALDHEFVLTLIREWAQAIAGVSAPLETPSPSGEPFQEASLPMDEL